MPGRDRWFRLTAYELDDFLTGTYRHIPLGHELLHIPLSMPSWPSCSPATAPPEASAGRARWPGSRWYFPPRAPPALSSSARGLPLCRFW
ncbi:MAG TPA: hypothetical protein VE196_07775 [Pseudonocardiaceae bacterium]|nr:hypothetical protein [Pseudonocardiaceae bacterium]